MCRGRLKLPVVGLSAAAGPVLPDALLDHADPHAFLKPAGLAGLATSDADLAVALCLTAVLNLAWKTSVSLNNMDAFLQMINAHVTSDFDYCDMHFKK